MQSLHNLISYDPETGLFRRANGKLVKNSPKRSGYIYIEVNGRRYRAHRLAWYLYFGYWPKVIDHLDHNESNNKLSNLRDVSHSDNILNSRLSRANSSGVKGVSWSKQHRKWMSGVKIDRRRKHLGLFSSREEARAAREVYLISLGKKV